MDREQARMAKLVVAGPLDERDCDDDLGTDPVDAFARQARSFRERRGGNEERVEARAHVAQHFRVEPRADFAVEHEIAVLARSDEQRAEPDARALWIGEAADE